jgi:intracellular sulfur oxidation DsrE/DsrF family protein
MRRLLVVISSLVVLLPAIASAAPAGKAIFDVRISNPGQLLIALKVIEETAEGIRQQGGTPEFVLAFRGGTLPLLKTAPKTEGYSDAAILSEVRERLADYREKGMVLEACNVAARMFKIEQKELDPNLHLVVNSLISVIDYQARGYSLVPMY